MSSPQNCLQHPRILDILQSCWRKLPETRPSFQDLANRLDRAMADLHGRQRPNSGAVEVAHSSRAHSMLVTVNPMLTEVGSPDAKFVESTTSGSRDSARYDLGSDGSAYAEYAPSEDGLYADQVTLIPPKAPPH
eukprot:Opistho-2@46388